MFAFYIPINFLYLIFDIDIEIYIDIDIDIDINLGQLMENIKYRDHK